MTLYGNEIRILPLQVRTTYADALERLVELHINNHTAALKSVSLNTKVYRGRKYLYAQGRIADGTVKHIYLGPFDEHARKVMDRFNREKREGSQVWEEIKTLGRILRGAGVPSLDPLESRVLSALSADGIFRVDGVLVGTIAFRCLIGSLGAQVKSVHALTADIDIAGRTIPVAVSNETVSPESALERLDLGFSPMLEAEAKLYGSRLKAKKVDFKVEFLTPLVGKESDRPAKIRQFNLPAIPLRFLDFLIEEPVYALALGRQPILVRVPAPERFAVHKLIVSQERKNDPLKVQKDLEQAFDLQKILQIMNPEGLEEMFAEARKKGPGWERRVAAGQQAMIRHLGDPLK
jgi:hypothetical protein